jgi:hypothetical protein
MVSHRNGAVLEALIRKQVATMGRLERCISFLDIFPFPGFYTKNLDLARSFRFFNELL